VIEKTGLAEFFLINWDLMRFAREHGVPGQGRGSAADSIVAYVLGITRVDRSSTTCFSSASCTRR
jgi:error-prone DNA polymerase